MTTDARAKVLALAYGVYDLAAHWRADQGREHTDGDPTEAMMGSRPDADPQRYREASPRFHVPVTAEDLRVLLIWGEADDVVLSVQSSDFAAALTAAGARVAMLPVAGAGHFWFSRDAIGDPAGHTHKVAPALLQFLRAGFAA